ncbi:MAG: hypothetical protein ACJ8AW_12830 [Rhodopila sp.]
MPFDTRVPLRQSRRTQFSIPHAQNAFSARWTVLTLSPLFVGQGLERGVAAAVLAQPLE